MGTSAGFRLFIHAEIIRRVSIIAVNIEVIIPIINVTAKPLIGPDPKLNKIKAAINVVKFASTIVLIALE